MATESVTICTSLESKIVLRIFLLSNTINGWFVSAKISHGSGGGPLPSPVSTKPSLSPKPSTSVV
jgi:hypothetical protein